MAAQELLVAQNLTAASEWSTTEPLIADDPRFKALPAADRRRLFENAVGDLWKQAAAQGVSTSFGLPTSEAPALHQKLCPNVMQARCERCLKRAS